MFDLRLDYYFIVDIDIMGIYEQKKVTERTIIIKHI